MLGDDYGKVTGASGQAVTVTAVSTDSIDLLAAKDLAIGAKLRMHVFVALAALAAGAATVNFEIITADDAALTDDVTVIGQSGPIPKAVLISPGSAGNLTGSVPIVVEMNPSYPTALGAPAAGLGAGTTTVGRRYLGARFTVATGPLTQGTFVVKFSMQHDAEPRVYPSGFTMAT